MSISADITFIPRVEQKVNLPVVVAGRAVQHVKKKGEAASALFADSVRCTPYTMNQFLTYRGPEPSHATRSISRRSKASLRGSMVADLPGFSRPRILQFESALEYAFLCLTLVRDDILHIWDQPQAVSYLDGSGKPAKHTFDFLVTKKNGERVAVAVKPMQRVIQRNFVSELERIAAAAPKQFADRVVLITDRHLDCHAAAVAARALSRGRPALTEVAA